MIRVTAARGGAATMPVVPRYPTPIGTLSNTISIVLPAKNEAQGLRRALPGLIAALLEAEVIVVDDGSTDETAQVAASLGAKVLTSPYSMGMAPRSSVVRAPPKATSWCSWMPTDSMVPRKSAAGAFAA